MRASVLPALLSAAAFFMFPATAALAADDDAITPYRPSVSSPAQLPAPGQVELELGGLRTKTAGLQRDSLPYQIKLAFSPQWGLLLGGEALVTTRDTTANDARIRGVGDTTLVLKRAFLIDEATAFGLEFGAKLPTARSDIGSGHADYDINGIFSRDIASLHVDTNLNLTRIGPVGDGSGLLQTGLSASFSHPLSQKWSLTGELSGTRRNDTPSTAQVLLALSYSPSKRMTLDFGVVRGLNPASPDHALFAGLVIPVANLW